MGIVACGHVGRGVASTPFLRTPRLQLHVYARFAATRHLEFGADDRIQLDLKGR